MNNITILNKLDHLLTPQEKAICIKQNKHVFTSDQLVKLVAQQTVNFTVEDTKKFIETFNNAGEEK